MTPDLALVEDVLQQAALEALLGIRRLRDPERFGSWLCGIALNLTRRALAQQGRTFRLPSDPTPAPDDVEEAVIAADLARRVRQAIATLPASQRDAVQLFYLEGLTHAEIVAELGIATGAVKARLHKARHRLKPLLLEETEAPMSPTAIDVEVRDVRREPSPPMGGFRTHVVVLAERAGQRVLPIFVGEPEGRAIALAMTDTDTPRPMTHQLTANLLDAVGCQVAGVTILRLAETTYFAEVALRGAGGSKAVDARPSDAITLALLAGAPIRVDADVFAQESEVPDHSLVSTDYADDAHAIAEEIIGNLTPLQLGPEVESGLDPDARALVAAAAERAKECRRSYVGTEHLLLAMVRRGTSLGLPDLGVNEAAIMDTFGVGDGTPAIGEPVLTPRLAQILRHALTAAQGRNVAVGPLDLLRALVDEPGGVAERVLDTASVDRLRLRQPPLP
jgi:uncharacterized protein